ncbi:hypothetical protein P0D75_30610 [Paraburkholderia sediminicola]|uniref:hypothetical protein n=1 Tax=Paraburkholderia sediminicola TaxID=458836 RepID=UPI0038BDBD8A
MARGDSTIRNVLAEWGSTETNREWVDLTVYPNPADIGIASEMTKAVSDTYLQWFTTPEDRGVSVQGTASAPPLKMRINPASASPTRRSGALTGRVSMSADFDALLRFDKATVERAARDNPDLPRSVATGTLRELAEARAGKIAPLRRKIRRRTQHHCSLWAEQQAAMLRAGRLAGLDRDNIFENWKTSCERWKRPTTPASW